MTLAEKEYIKDMRHMEYMKMMAEKEKQMEKKDMVNSPAHYTRGTQEAIDIIEEAIQDAPDVKAGMLQAQALKYLLRLWLKGNAPQDSEKAQWYLSRLIDHLKETQ